MKQSHSKVGNVEIPGVGQVSVNIVLEADCDEANAASIDAKLKAWVDTKFSQLTYQG